MKTGIKKLSRTTLALLVAAFLLFASGGVMGTRAALTITSDEHQVQINLDVLDTALMENGKATAENDGVLLKDLEEVTIVPGKVYKEELAVKNNSDYDQYVRLVIRKYWKNSDGQKVIDLEPDLILTVFDKKDGYNTGDWYLNEAESTAERAVYYYNKKLGRGDTTSALIDGIRVNSTILNDVGTSTQGDNPTIITYEYKYNGYSFGLEAEAQAVQTHHADEAIPSIWGVDAGDTKINIE